MTFSGLDMLIKELPAELVGKRVGVLCHAPSIDRNYNHIIDILASSSLCKLSAIFGPQHGVSGQTQDNMIEWQSFRHPIYQVPVYSLYGEHRKPTPEMLENLDALILDVQDVGTRVYTYAWTVKYCMEAAMEKGIPVVVLDRPNPIAHLGVDGAVLKKEFFTFVGLAEIPLCHSLTMGELALFMQKKYLPNCDLKVVKMSNYHHQMRYQECGLPWVPPSPNMPTERTAVVYPGAVLIEALNLSEARGTTTPFELFGATYIDAQKLKLELDSRDIAGCKFRIHNYIPTFHKFAKQECEGIFLHVTDESKFRPVRCFAEIFEAIIKTSRYEDALQFLEPPYEYEYHLKPFDILSGDSGLRESLKAKESLAEEFAKWDNELDKFVEEAKPIRLYS